MNNMIDCFLVGHNEMPFSGYESNLRKMGTDSGAYRDLSKSILTINKKILPISDVINIVGASTPGHTTFRPFNMLETHSNAIGYLGTYLHRRGFTFDYVNSFQDEKEYFGDLLKAGRIRTVAIITTLYVSVFPILEIMEFVRKYSNKVKVIVGGPFISTQIRTQDSTFVNYLFRSIGADFYVNSSQGELTLVNILNTLRENGSPANLYNTYYKSGTEYLPTPELKEDNKLVDNTVNWDLFAHRVHEHVAVRTAISCPYKCSFCGFPAHAGDYQTTDVAPIIEELKLLSKIPTLKSVHFVDDTFNIPKERFKTLLREKIRHGFDFKWHSYYRCQFADDETMKLMKESGCEGVFLGIESGSNRILKNMDKAATAEHYRRGIELLKKYEIATFGSFIIGFPGETEETVRETVDFIEETEMDFYRTQQWYFEPITPIWKQKDKYKIKGESFEWSHETMDAKTACDIVDQNFLSIKNSLWLPQYNFDFDNLLHLLHRGKTLPQLKQFIAAFNEGVRDKLLHPHKEEADVSVLKKMKEAWAGETETTEMMPLQEATADAQLNDMFKF
ncbi:PhpK family radical SAM P-methyltransferase [Chitinophaga rhizophila]|uniref:PhpK family radical SAM P-methyltransferase n=1 Tax=Chitinophaga rhizophila TaxID=2866212 RepID=A0ABS7GIF6_9BACT|nr:PhpK family radical SAM P-methyltransferase [Chitinophaga rhizophila]MBW8687201.1 PhpK family radical SAM P-methyltransferase [Chitinophaga rhizophila]